MMVKDIVSGTLKVQELTISKSVKMKIYFNQKNSDPWWKLGAARMNAKK